MTMKLYNQIILSFLLGSLLLTARAYSSSLLASDSTSTQLVAPNPTLKTVNMFNAGNYLMLECLFKRQVRPIFW